MADMTTADILAMVKVDLGITTTAYDDRLTQYIEAAKIQIAREGATLDMSNIDHVNTVAMYAGWTWRKRDTGEGMPRMLRYSLNNLVLSQKMSGGEADG